METKKNTMNTKDVIAKDNLTLRDYAQIKFMSAIISNADTMREITKSWTQAPKNNRCDFEEMIAKISGSYADAMLKQREL